MNSYHPATSRTLVGVAAAFMSVATLAVAVLAPASLDSVSHDVRLQLDHVGVRLQRAGEVGDHQMDVGLREQAFDLSRHVAGRLGRRCDLRPRWILRRCRRT